MLPLSLADTQTLIKETLTRTSVFSGPNIIGTVSGNTFVATRQISVGTTNNTDWINGTISAIDEQTTMVDISVDTSLPFIVLFIAQIIGLVVILYHIFSRYNSLSEKDEKFLLIVILLVGGIIASRIAPVTIKSAFRETFEKTLGVRPISINNS